jgi:BlaI family transcriptional regulator, penicillinase repressor
MAPEATPPLSRREREIMDVLHRLGRASVHDVMRLLSGNTSYSTVRAQLTVLEKKGHIVHEEEQLRYVYLPATPPQAARRTALEHLIDTFFDGSPELVVETLVGRERSSLSDAELDRIAQMIERVRSEARPSRGRRPR